MQGPCAWVSAADGQGAFYVVGCFLRKPKMPKRKGAPQLQAKVVPSKPPLFDVAVLVITSTADIREGEVLKRQDARGVNTLLSTLEEGLGVGKFAELPLDVARDSLITPALSRSIRSGTTLNSSAKLPVLMWKDGTASATQATGASSYLQGFLDLQPTPRALVHEDTITCLMFTCSEYRSWWMRSDCLKRHGCDLLPLQSRSSSLEIRRWVLRSVRRLDTMDNRQFLSSLLGHQALWCWLHGDTVNASLFKCGQRLSRHQLTDNPFFRAYMHHTAVVASSYIYPAPVDPSGPRREAERERGATTDVAKKSSGVFSVSASSAGASRTDLFQETAGTMGVVNLDEGPLGQGGADTREVGSAAMATVEENNVRAWIEQCRGQSCRICGSSQSTACSFMDGTPSFGDECARWRLTRILRIWDAVATHPYGFSSHLGWVEPRYHDESEDVGGQVLDGLDAVPIDEIGGIDGKLLDAAATEYAEICCQKHVRFSTYDFPSVLGDCAPDESESKRSGGGGAAAATHRSGGNPKLLRKNVVPTTTTPAANFPVTRVKGYSNSRNRSPVNFQISSAYPTAVQAMPLAFSGPDGVVGSGISVPPGLLPEASKYPRSLFAFSKPPFASPCDNDCDKPARFFCDACDESYCAECDSGQHRSAKKKLHKRTEIQLAAAPGCITGTDTPCEIPEKTNDASSRAHKAKDADDDDGAFLTYTEACTDTLANFLAEFGREACDRATTICLMHTLERVSEAHPAPTPAVVEGLRDRLCFFTSALIPAWLQAYRLELEPPPHLPSPPSEMDVRPSRPSSSALHAHSTSNISSLALAPGSLVSVISGSAPPRSSCSSPSGMTASLEMVERWLKTGSSSSSSRRSNSSSHSASAPVRGDKRMRQFRSSKVTSLSFADFSRDLSKEPKVKRASSVDDHNPMMEPSSPTLSESSIASSHSCVSAVSAISSLSTPSVSGISTITTSSAVSAITAPLSVYSQAFSQESSSSRAMSTCSVSSATIDLHPLPWSSVLSYQQLSALVSDIFLSAFGPSPASQTASNASPSGPSCDSPQAVNSSQAPPDTAERELAETCARAFTDSLTVYLDELSANLNSSSLSACLDLPVPKDSVAAEGLSAETVLDVSLHDHNLPPLPQNPRPGQSLARATLVRAMLGNRQISRGVDDHPGQWSAGQQQAWASDDGLPFSLSLGAIAEDECRSALRFSLEDLSALVLDALGLSFTWPARVPGGSSTRSASAGRKPLSVVIVLDNQGGNACLSKAAATPEYSPRQIAGVVVERIRACSTLHGGTANASSNLDAGETLPARPPSPGLDSGEQASRTSKPLMSACFRVVASGEGGSAGGAGLPTAESVVVTESVVEPRHELLSSAEGRRALVGSCFQAVSTLCSQAPAHLEFTFSGALGNPPPVISSAVLRSQAPETSPAAPKRTRGGRVRGKPALPLNRSSWPSG